MAHYTIRVGGHLAARWSVWLAGMELRHEADGTTTLFGTLPDQSALFGVLMKISDLNLPLLAVERAGETTVDECYGERP
jgi:hypothetical protein